MLAQQRAVTAHRITAANGPTGAARLLGSPASLPHAHEGVARGARLAHLEKGRQDVVQLSMACVGFTSPLWQSTAARDSAHPAGIAKILPKGK